MSDDRLMDIREAAALLGIVPGTLSHWVSEKRVPYVKFSARCIRFRLSDLEQWIAQKVQVPTTDNLRGGNTRTGGGISQGLRPNCRAKKGSPSLDGPHRLCPEKGADGQTAEKVQINPKAVPKEKDAEASGTA